MREVKVRCEFEGRSEAGKVVNEPSKGGVPVQTESSLPHLGSNHFKQAFAMKAIRRK